MAFQYQKELKQLKAQAEKGGEGQLGLFRMVVLGSLVLSGLCWVLIAFSGHGDDLTWAELTELTVMERVHWLEELPFGDYAGSLYLRYSSNVVGLLVSEDNRKASYSQVNVGAIQTWGKLLARRVSSGLLFIGFGVLVGAPIWFLGILLGGILLLTEIKIGRGADLLGVCDRGVSLFYSGIHAAVDPTNLKDGQASVPSLALPPLASNGEAKRSQLLQVTSRLQLDSRVEALFFQLIRVITKCRDYPSYVYPERPSDDYARGVVSNVDSEKPDNSDVDEPLSANVLNLEDWTRQFLEAAVEVTAFLRKYFSEMAAQGTAVDYFEYWQAREKVLSNLSPLARSLLSCLTPLRAQEAGSDQKRILPTSILAVAAGRSLVYQPSGGGFLQISRFPGLQARAVLQSFPEFAKAFNSEERRVIRTGILGCRRNGDVGRGLLPRDSSVFIKAVRDLLEVGSAFPVDEGNTAAVVEFDGLIEELHEAWRKGLKSFLEARDSTAGAKEAENSVPALVGVPFRGVVLFPLTKLIELVYSQVDSQCFERLKFLQDRVYAEKLFPRVSNRLPGLSNQREQLSFRDILESGSSSLLAQQENGKQILNRWYVAREMLVRFNWLSSRVGEDAVPSDGLVQAVFFAGDNLDSRGESFKRPKQVIGGIATLVPLRKRRFQEMFGENWLSRFYSSAPPISQLNVFVDGQMFSEAMRRGVG